MDVYCLSAIKHKTGTEVPRSLFQPIPALYPCLRSLAVMSSSHIISAIVQLCGFIKITFPHYLFGIVSIT